MNLIIGNFLIFTYCILSAISFVALNSVEQKINPALLTFYTFLLLSILFFLVSFKKLLAKKHILVQNWRLLIKINIVNAFSWCLTFYCFKYLTPSDGAAIILGTMPLITLLLNRDNLSQTSRMDWFFSLLILLTIIGIIVDSLYEAFTYDRKDIIMISASIALAIVSAIANTLSNLYGKKLNLQGITPNMILGIRFWFVVLALFLFMKYQGSSFAIPKNEIDVVLMMALISAIIPLYCLQLGIHYTDPVTLSFIVPTLPVITLGIEFFDPAIHLSMAKIILTILLTLFILFATGYRTITSTKKSLPKNN